MTCGLPQHSIRLSCQGFRALALPDHAIRALPRRGRGTTLRSNGGAQQSRPATPSTCRPRPRLRNAGAQRGDCRAESGCPQRIRNASHRWEARLGFSHSRPPAGLPTISHREMRRRFQKTPKAQGSVCDDAMLPKDNLIQPIERNTQALRCFELPHAERLEVLLEQNLARRNRRTYPVRIPSLVRTKS